MKKNIKAFMMLLPMMAAAFTMSCNDDEAVTYSGNDVSDRVSSLSSSDPGQGANLTVTGERLDEVVRLFVGNQVVTQDDFVSQEESSLTFVVPSTATLGKNRLLLVWPGHATAADTVNVVKFHTLRQIGPLAAAPGQTVTLFGNNLDLVEVVEVGGVEGTIVSQSLGILKFEMPAGASTGPVSLSSNAGVFTSATNLVACDAEPGAVGCLPVINTNGSFEEGEVGTVGVISVPGWSLGGSRVTSVITDEDAYDGYQSAKITINEIGTNAWDIQPTSTMTVDPTATYRLSLWVKGSGIANIKFAMDEAGTPGYTEWGSPTMAISTTEWTEVAYTFSPASEAVDGTARFAVSMSYAGNVGGVLYMDNLRVEKIN